MTDSFYQQAGVILQLLHRDFYIFKRSFLHRLRMALYWVVISVAIARMFLPSMGLDNFAPFILISSAISYGLFIVMQNAMNLVEDITENHAIAYELTLPVAQWLIFLKIMISNALQSFVISLSIVPCGLLLLMNSHAFPDFSCWKFILIFICASIFYGAFSLILAISLKDMSKVDNVWLRILFPIWYLGCFQFPWSVLYKVSPTLAYLDLCNPITYILEGGRSATINSSGSLPFMLCCTMILFFAAICSILGIHFMKKRLNCI